MRSIFVTSFHPFISRNILRTDLFLLIRENIDVHFYILVPELKADFFKKEFENNFVTILPIKGAPSGRLSPIFKKVARAMFGVRMDFITAFKSENNNRFKAFFKELFYFPVFSFLGKFFLFRMLLRYLDYHLARDTRFVELLSKYKPDIVFSTDVQNQNDVGLLKESRKLGIKTIASVRSWDNLTVHGLLRLLPDLLLVPSLIMKDDAVRYDDIDPDKVKVVGIPHYDKYLKGPTLSKDHFLGSMDADTTKHTLLYAPIGDMYLKSNDIDQIVLEELSKFDANIIVRLPPTDTVNLDIKSFPKNVFFYAPGVSFETDPRNSDVGRREISSADDEQLINSLYFSDVVICGPSTIIVDASLLDRPIVAIGFDGKIKRNYKDGVRQYYDYEYIKSVSDCDAVTLATSLPEMVSSINSYLNDKTRKSVGRNKLARLQAFKLDGKSTLRMARAITGML